MMEFAVLWAETRVHFVKVLRIFKCGLSGSVAWR